MPKPAPRRSFRDRPPSSSYTQNDPGRTERYVHAVADQESDDREGEKQARKKRKHGENPGSNERGATSSQPRGFASFRAKRWLRTTGVTASCGRRALRRCCSVPITMHQSLVFSLTAL